MSDDSDSTSRDRARLFGRLSLACTALVVFISIVVPIHGFRSIPVFGSCLAIAVIGLLVGLAGIDARRSCEGPRPMSPGWGVALAVLSAIYVLILRWVVTVPIHM